MSMLNGSPSVIKEVYDRLCAFSGNRPVEFSHPVYAQIVTPTTRAYETISQTKKGLHHHSACYISGDSASQRWIVYATNNDRRASDLDEEIRVVTLTGFEPQIYPGTISPDVQRKLVVALGNRTIRIPGILSARREGGIYHSGELISSTEDLAPRDLAHLIAPDLRLSGGEAAVLSPIVLEAPKLTEAT